MRRLPPVTVTVGLGLALAAALSACGGDDGGGGSGSGLGGDVTNAVRVTASDPFDYDRESYGADAGEVSFELTNDGSIQHTLVLEDQDFRLVTSKNGDVDSGAIDLDAGEYTIYCDVAGHRAGGMEATVTIG
jgi:plastocyanin